MKPTFHIMLLASAIAFTVGFATAVRAESQMARKFPASQLKEDFKIARNALEEAHPGLYRLTKKSEMDRVFDQAEKSLDHPMNFYEFYRVMALPIAAIKCGHTDIDISDEVRKETESLPWLPFDVKVLDKKAYIFRDYAKQGALAGMEIQTINGVPVARVLSTMFAAESQDGDIQTSRQWVIGQHFALNLIALLDLKAPYEITLTRPGSDKTEMFQLAGITRDERIQMSKALYPQDHGKKKSKNLTFFDNGQIAMLTYPFFGTDIDEARVFVKRSFEEIHARKAQTLILDLRGNLGGEDEIASILFSYLVDDPFKFFDDLILTKSSGMSYSFARFTDKHRDMIIPPGFAELRADGKIHQTNDLLTAIQQPGKPAFKGPIYILINCRCFSSGAEFLTEVHVHHLAAFVGEESGGAYYGNNSGDVERITLPNTKLGLFIPLISGYMSVEGAHEHDAARGIIPDFPVKRTMADLLTGADRDLELALELSRKRR